MCMLHSAIDVILIHFRFTALVNIIASLVGASRFSKFRHVMDEYIKNHFKSTNACTHILEVLKDCLDNMDDPQRNKLLRETMKVCSL